MTQHPVPPSARVVDLLSTAAARPDAEQRELRALVSELLHAVRSFPLELRALREDLARLSTAQQELAGELQTSVMRSQGSLNGLVATQLAAMEERLAERLDGTLVAVVEAMLSRQDGVDVPAQAPRG